MFLFRLEISLHSLLLFIAFLSGCDRRPPLVVISPESPEVREAYIQCGAHESDYELSFVVLDSLGNEHKEIFPLKRGVVSQYPSHPGGIAAGDGPDGGFNRSCFIEAGTDTAVAIRFRLNASARTDKGLDLNLDELVWGAVGLDTSVDLPQGAKATLKFKKASAPMSRKGC